MASDRWLWVCSI